MPSKIFARCSLALLIFSLAACQAVPNLGPTPTGTVQPASTHTPVATPIPSPTPAVLVLNFPSAAWQELNIKTICLDITEDYSQELAYATAKIHQEEVALLLQALGFQTVSAEEACDASLELLLDYSVNSATYNTFDGSSSFDCIVGASFGGSLLLSTPGHLPLLQSIFTEIANAPTVVLNGCPDQTETFGSAWRKMFLENLSSLMGPQVITFLYTSEDKAVRNAALAASGAFGPEDMEVLPQVIQALKEYPGYAGEISTGLQNMGPDAQEAAWEAIPGLIERLQASRGSMPEGIDPVMFYQSDIETLGKLGPAAKDAVPLLLEILKDPDASSAQISVITALGEIGPGAADAIPELMELTDDPFIGSSAAEALGKIGSTDPEVLSFFIEKADISAGGFIDLTGLAHMAPSADSIKALTEIYQNKSVVSHSRSQAIQALGAMTGASAETLPVLIAASQDGDPVIAASALRALGDLGPVSPEILPVLKKGLSNSNDSVQWAAASALGNFGSDAAETVPALIAIVKSPKQVSLARLGAVSTLGKIGQASPEVIAALTGALKTAPAQAAEALEQLGPPARASVPGLIEALREENANPEMYENQLPFVRALLAITGEYHGFKAENWQAWWDTQPKE